MQQGVNAKQIFKYILGAIGLILLPFIIMNIKAVLMLLAIAVGAVVALYAAYKVATVLFGLAIIGVGLVVVLSAAGWMFHLM